MTALIVAVLLGAAQGVAPAEVIRCEALKGDVRCKDAVTVAADDDARVVGRPLASSVLSADDLRALGPDPQILIDFALRSAGANLGSQRIFIDGMPATGAVAAALISRITINADPFSVDNAGVDQIRIDIELKEPSRRWNFDASAPSLGAGGGERIAATSSPQTRNISAGLSGPIRGLPLTFSLHGDRYSDVRQPVFTSPLTGAAFSDAAVTSGTDSSSLSAGVVLAVRGGRVRATLFDSRTALTHAGIGALVAAAAGSSLTTATTQLQSSWRTAGRSWIHRGGFSWRRGVLDATADSQSPAVVVAYQSVSGGNDQAAETRRSTGWTVRDVFESAGRGRPWLAGVEASRDAVRATQDPNPSGRLQLASVGAATGTWFVTRGAAAAGALTSSAALFAQRLLIDSRALTLRAGARADWQNRDGVIFSPRVAMRTLAPAAVQIGAAAGLFAGSWSPDLLLDVSRRDGSGARDFVVPDTAASDLTHFGAAAGLPLSARFAPQFGRRRDLMVRGVIQRRFGRWDIGAEHTWTEGLLLAGSTREREAGSLVDVVASDRHLRRQQTHARVAAAWPRYTLLVHYEHARSLDDTDGPFTFAERANLPTNEWGPSTAVAQHAVGVVAALALPAAVRLSLTFETRSGRPFNILTGGDAEGLATYTDRDGLPRNAGIGPSSRNLSAYFYRAIAPKRLRGLRLDAGVRLENLLNAINVMSVGQVTSSALFGRALSAGAGRSARVWLTAGR